MDISKFQGDVKQMADNLTFKQMADRSLSLIEEMYKEFGDNERVGRWVGTKKCFILTYKLFANYFIDDTFLMC